MRPITIAAALLAAAGCGSGDDHVAIGTISVRHPAGPDVRWLNVRNAIGSIRVTPAADDEIAVRADVSVRPALRSRHPVAEPERDLRVIQEDDVVSITCPHSRDGSDWKLDLAITAPARLHWTIVQTAGAVRLAGDGTHISASVAAGDLEVSGAVGHLELVATAGALWVDVERLGGGFLNATTGAVKVVVRDSGPTEELTLAAAAGGVEIELPRDASVDVELDASLGGIEVRGAPDVKREKGLVGQRASGSVGRGGPRVTATAGVGGIRFAVRD